MLILRVTLDDLKYPRFNQFFVILKGPIDIPEYELIQIFVFVSRSKVGGCGCGLKSSQVRFIMENKVVVELVLHTK